MVDHLLEDLERHRGDARARPGTRGVACAFALAFGVRPMHAACAAALAALLAHPVFCTDPDEGTVTVVLHFHARDQSDGGFPAPTTAF
jgi:hypothetical protein